LVANSEKILQVKQILQQSCIQYLLINLNKEKQIKVKKGLSNGQGVSLRNTSEEENLVSNSEVNLLNKE
jgi:hypothetical protein